MNKHTIRTLALVMVTAALAGAGLSPKTHQGQLASSVLSWEGEAPAEPIFPARQEPRPPKIEHHQPARVPWTSSRLTGSPDPPHPYRMDRVFPKLSFNNPLLMNSAPGTRRLFVGEQGGKIFSFLPDPNCAKPDLFLDIRADIKSWDPKSNVKSLDALYGLTFHPKFVENRYCYICYVLSSKSGKPLPDGSRVSRFRVTDTEPPRVDPKSEKVLITFLAGGHNGGCLAFGPDGCLYISTGDAANPNPPDALDTGQDISDLLSSILRIDVDHEDPGKAYAVPPDNPFVKTPGARPEVWAYGFRNPWKMSFDRVSGDLWVGDVGWELWEMIYHVKKGGNYGWSVMEGRQPVKPNGKRGPTPIQPPALDFPHTEAASITGGYVYRGKRYPDLVGTYLCGDWVTRRVWGTRFDGDRIISHRELAHGIPKVVAFCEDNDGELYIVHYDVNGTIHQLVPNTSQPDTSASFPRKLSETGLFASLRENKPAPGVIPFRVQVEQWADYATAERFLGLPGTSSVKIFDQPQPIPGDFYSYRIFFPKDGVLARTVSLEMEHGNPRSRRRLETQILHFDGAAWHGYTYQWNDEQTEATLVPAAGAERTFTVVDSTTPGGKRRHQHHFPSRAECMTCHNPWVGFCLAFNVAQLDRDGEIDGLAGNQLHSLEQLGYVVPATANEKKTPKLRTTADRLCNPYDDKADLQLRARSYLQVNCAHCHQFGAGGTADLELRADKPLAQMKLVNVRPVQGTFEIPEARLIAPGDPYRSVLYYRMAKMGGGRMPHVGSALVDDRGVRLVHDWIRQLQPKEAAEKSEGQRRELQRKQTLAELCSREMGSEHKQAQLQRILGSTDTALWLSYLLSCKEGESLPKAQVLAAASARPEGHIRDLFERFLPEDQRVKRLGTLIKPEQILSLRGDASRGQELIFKNATLQCMNCHQIGNKGIALGPNLEKIGSKYSRAVLLESILDPSKSIDPKYQSYLVTTRDGRVFTGLIVEKSSRGVVLRDAQNKEVRVPTEQVDTTAPQAKSLMPDQLLRDLTAEQAADLLAFLESLK